MTAFCCPVCLHEPTCRDLLESAFARPEDVSTHEEQA